MSGFRRSTQAPERQFRFSRGLRLTRGGDLRRVVREGKRVRTEHLELRAIASPLSHPRVGLIVPKHGRSSVERNRLKRQLREIARLALIPMLPRVDLVIRAHRQAYAASFEVLREEVEGAAVKIGRLVQGEG